MSEENKPCVVVLAAGMGSRYGGLKQVAEITEGKTLLDYSIADIQDAGFRKIVFIIRPEMREEFEKKVTSKWSGSLQIEFSYQTMKSFLPAEATVPDGRKKPWGTAHAVLCAQDQVQENFAVMNADDYYGKTSWQTLYHFLSNNSGDHFTLLAFPLGKTLSPFGSVSRGVCLVEDGMLRNVVEKYSLTLQDGKIYDDGELKEDLSTETLVSMNLWGFTPNIFPQLEKQFCHFVKDLPQPEKSEFLLPTSVQEEIAHRGVKVTVLSSTEKWAGITYSEDLDWVKSVLK